MPEIARLNHRHEQIVNWLILNPDRSLGECAAAFGYTQAWLSQIVHSDMFQARYRAACEEVGELAVHTIHNKLSGLTAAVIEKSLEKIELGQATERFLGDTLRTSLQSLGYGSGPPINGNGNGSTQININIQAQALAAARERVALARAGSTPAKAEGIEVSGSNGHSLVAGNLLENKTMLRDRIQELLNEEGS